MITFQCPTCFHEMRAKETPLGKKVRCKECNETVTVEIGEPPDDDVDDDAENDPVFNKPASSSPVRKKRSAPTAPAAPRHNWPSNTQATSQPAATRPPDMPLIGGPTPVPTVGIESLAVVKRGMKVWAFNGRWEQGTIVGRNPTG